MNKTINDTTSVLKVAVQEGVSLRHMPDASALFTRPSSNSVFLTSKDLPLHLLPLTSGNTHFQVLSKEEICTNIDKIGYLDHPRYYLEIVAFEKSDTGYYVLMRAIGCSGYSSGGALSLYLKKTADSIVVVDRNSSSIN